MTCQIEIEPRSEPSRRRRATEEHPVEPDHRPADPPSEPGLDPSGAPVVCFEPVWGPAVDQAISLEPGRYVVGRAAGARVRVDDPLVEAHHALVTVSASGSVEIVQLTGRVPIQVDGGPLGPSPAERRRQLTAGSVVDVGASRLRLGPPPPRSPPAGRRPLADDPVSCLVIRPPRRTVDPEHPPVAPVVVPEAVATSSGREVGPGLSGLVGALVGLTGSATVAVVMGHVLFMVFGVVGAATAVATWSVGALRHRRQVARERQVRAEAAERFRTDVLRARHEIGAAHVATTSTAARALARVDTDALWCRRAHHGDAFTVSLGVGSVRRPIPTAPESVTSLPSEVVGLLERAAEHGEMPVEVALDRRRRQVVVIAGPGAACVIRALVVQLAVQAGPADWWLRVVTSVPDRHGWLTQLPHARGGRGGHCIVDPHDRSAVADLRGALGGEQRRLVLLVDDPDLLTSRSSDVRRLLDDDGHGEITVLVHAESEHDVPGLATELLVTGERSTARWWQLADGDGASTEGRVAPGAESTGAGMPQRLRVAGISPQVGWQVARALSGLADPEDERMAGGDLPDDVRLVGLPGVACTAEAIGRAWSSVGPDPGLAAPVGVSAGGVVEVDLVRDGPHALVAGTTGSGKSELLRTLVVSMASRVGPQHLNFVLVDYKGGSTFDRCADLPHTVGLVTDLDGGLAARALSSLDAELHRRERVLRGCGAADLAAYRAVAGVEPLPRLVIVVDEFAALANELPEFLAALVGVAQRGRSLGMHLVLATQRPAGVVDDAIKANTDLRIALRLHDAADALDVVGAAEPAGFSRRVPGRAAMRIGAHETLVFQSARCSISGGGHSVHQVDTDGAAHAPEGRSDLDRLVDEIRTAADRLDIAPPHRPWLPSLDRDLPPAQIPELVTTHGDHGSADAGAIGVIDDPVGQCRRPLRWSGDVNLALVGSVGAGTTTGLIAVTQAHTATADARTVYVVDARGDRRLDALSWLADVAGVVRVHDDERLWRVLTKVAAEMEQRRTGGAGDTPAPVLVIDGLGALRRCLDRPGPCDLLGLLDRILTDGPAVGVHTVAAVEPDGSVASTLGRFGERWVFHLDDPSFGPLVGVTASRLPAPIPGRVVVTSSGLEAQIARPAAIEPRRDTFATTVPVLASDVGVDSLHPARVVDGVVHLPLGISFDDLGPAAVELPPGAHLLVVGPARSGRTTALVRLVHAWRDLHPAGAIDLYGGASTSLRTACDGPSAGPRRGANARLVVVDDAELVDDPRGDLRGAVATTDGSVTVIASARADALRGLYGHWTEGLRRQRSGLVMTGGGEHDGELFGVSLPRRWVIAPRTGLAWLVTAGRAELVQVAR